MPDDVEERLDRIIARLNNTLGEKEVVIDDFIFTENEEKAWFEAEPDFTKRIVTPLPTKQRRRVTLLYTTVLRLHSFPNSVRSIAQVL